MTPVDADGCECQRAVGSSLEGSVLKLHYASGALGLLRYGNRQFRPSRLLFAGPGHTVGDRPVIGFLKTPIIRERVREPGESRLDHPLLDRVVETLHKKQSQRGRPRYSKAKFSTHRSRKDFVGFRRPCSRQLWIILGCDS